MKTNYATMVKLADDKYRKLMDYMYQVKCGSDIDFDKAFNLINSVHEDEIMLIISLREAESLNLRTELDIPSFMLNN